MSRTITSGSRTAIGDIRRERETQRSSIPSQRLVAVDNARDDARRDKHGQGRHDDLADPNDDPDRRPSRSPYTSKKDRSSYDSKFSRVMSDTAGTSFDRSVSVSKSAELRAQFLELRLGAFEEVLQFFKHNRPSLTFEEKEILETAREALKSRRIVSARQCIQQGLLLRDWDRDHKQAKRFFEDLIDGDDESLDQFRRDLDTVLIPLDQKAVRISAVGSMSSSSCFSPPEDRSVHRVTMPPLDPVTRSASRNLRESEEACTTNGIANSELDSDYYSSQSRQFFIVGRVFSLMCPEIGKSFMGRRARGKFRPDYIRHFIVVQRESSDSCSSPSVLSDSCLCVLVEVSDRRENVQRRGLDDHGGVHSLVHEVGKEPTLPPGGKHPNRPPIAVNASAIFVFDSGSCIDYSKVYTIQW